jgi:hypothetical protein
MIWLYLVCWILKSWLGCCFSDSILHLDIQVVTIASYLEELTVGGIPLPYDGDALDGAVVCVPLVVTVLGQTDEVSPV